MTIIETIKEELKTAMKEKNQLALDAYRAVLSACVNELVSLGKTPQDSLTDEEVIKVIGRIVKQRKDSISQFAQAGRNDLAEEDSAQLVLLEAFLPAQLSEEEIHTFAQKKKEELGIIDSTKKGILVGALMKDFAGKADGQVVKKVVDMLF